MIKLKPLDIDNKILLDNIISKKHTRNKMKCTQCGQGGTALCSSCDNHDNRALMEAEKLYVLKRYTSYMKNINNLNAIIAEKRITGYTKDLFINSYESSTIFKRERAKIFHDLPPAIQAKCPFCMVSAPNTLDHYFDKNDYPEYSFFIPNLIPCCSQCNNKKGTEIFLSNGERKVLHYYYDEIPEYQFLFLTMKLRDAVPVFQINLKLSDTKEVDRIIKNQFVTLDLEERYKAQFNDRISSIVSEFKEYYINGHDIGGLVDMLNIRVRSIRKYNGVNYWEASLYECLAEGSNLQELLK